MSPAVEMDNARPGGGCGAAAEMEARFADLCKTELALEEIAAREAAVLFKETAGIMSANAAAIGSGSPDEMERLWSAFVLYCIARLGRPGRDKADGGGVSLTQVWGFFKEMPQFSLKAGFVLSGIYGSDWEKKLGLKELQASIVQLSHLNSFGQCRIYISDYHRFGWLLFLALRVHDFGPFKDMVTCTNGLVSIMVILILHVPVHVRSFSIQDSSSFARKSNNGINLLASLSDVYNTSEDELKITLGKVNKLIIDVLKKKPRPASECKKENLDYIDPDGLIYFEDLLEDISLQSCLLILENDYDVSISIKGELDERVLVNDDSSLHCSGSLSGGAISISGTKRKVDAIVSPPKTITSPLTPPCSPAPSVNGNIVGNLRVPTTTPVSTAMTTAKWLRTVNSPLSSEPSVELEHFLSLCGKDVTSDVVRRASIILETIFPSNSFGERCITGYWESMSMTDSTWAEQRKLEALKLYYRVLEATCRAESHTVRGNNLTSLLSNERFHRCMLACSAELVLATYKTITMTFPAVLEKTGITAFDLSKVIECFIRHEEILPRELKRYLNFLDERLLESMVWEKGSWMYNSLIVARPALSDEINRLGLLAELLPSLDTIAMHHNIYIGSMPPLPSQKQGTSPDQHGDVQSPEKECVEHRSVLMERNSFTSPIKERLFTFNSLRSKIPPLHSAFASPTRRYSAGGETCGETGINVFFGKVLKLAASRIRTLCERLDLSQQIQERIYCLIQQILSHRAALFFNRRIDQIILCSFYGVAKISQLSTTFQEIIYNYRKQPQCKPQVFRSVFVSWPSTNRNGKTGKEHVDIITFYNEIFIPCVKPLLVELGPSGGAKKGSMGLEDKNNAGGKTQGSPRWSPFPNLPDMSPKKVSAAHNVYVSPLRSSKMDALLSPSSKSYYACVGESTHAYQSPSKDLSVINDRLNSGKKINGKLNFDMVSDSVVAGSFGLQNGSSVSSAAIMNPPSKREQSDCHSTPITTRVSRLIHNCDSSANFMRCVLELYGIGNRLRAAYHCRIKQICCPFSLALNLYGLNAFYMRKAWATD